MKSSRPGSAHWRSSNTSTVVPLDQRSARRTSATPRTAPRGRRAAPRRTRAGTAAGPRSAALVGVGHELLERRRDPRAAGRLVVALRQAGPAADHLAQRPERDPLAVRRRSALVPVDDLEHAVDVLEELPREPALADPALAGDRDQAGTPLAGRRMEEVPQQPQLVVAADERRLEAFGPALAAALGNHAQRPPGRHRRLPCRAAPARPPPRTRSHRLVARWVASPTSTLFGGATDWSRLAVLTRSPATMPWFVAPSVTAASPVSTPARASRPRPSAPGSSARTDSIRSSAARTARSASSSWATGVPHTAMTASPMNFSTVPP